MRKHISLGPSTGAHTHTSLIRMSASRDRFGSTYRLALAETHEHISPGAGRAYHRARRACCRARAMTSRARMPPGITGEKVLRCLLTHTPADALARAKGGGPLYLVGTAADRTPVAPFAPLISSLLDLSPTGAGTSARPRRRHSLTSKNCSLASLALASGPPPT